MTFSLSAIEKQSWQTMISEMLVSTKPVKTATLELFQLKVINVAFATIKNYIQELKQANHEYSRKLDEIMAEILPRCNPTDSEISKLDYQSLKWLHSVVAERQKPELKKIEMRLFQAIFMRCAHTKTSSTGVKF